MTFPELLRKSREEAGFPSARAFFNAHGGKAFFGCTYKQYLNVENGRSALQPRLAHRLSSVFSIRGDPRRLREFALACLESLLGSKDLAEFLAAAACGPRTAAAPEAPLSRALERNYSQRISPLSKSQSALIRSSVTTYWCLTFLANDARHFRAAELAALIGCPEPDAAGSLRQLLSAKLVSRDAKGAYYCPKAGAVLVHPGGELHVSPVTEELGRHWERMADRSGKLLFRHFLFTRASELELKSYFPMLVQGVHGADIYSTCEKGPDTAFVIVESSVKRITPF